MAAISISVVKNGETHTYVFPHARPTLMSLTCVIGPNLFLPRPGAAPYVNPNMFLADLPSQRVFAVDWTRATIDTYNGFFLAQLHAVIADIDARLPALPSDGDEAVSLRTMRANLSSTIERERKN